MLTKFIRPLAVSMLLTLTTIWLGCEEIPEAPEYENPLDPDVPTGEYVPPETNILTGPADGTTIDDHSVTFTWSGNQNVVEYAYRLTGGDWSAWSRDSSVTLAYMDEGDYLFVVKGRFASLAEDETPATRDFTIDDIHGPALWFSTRRVPAQAGSEFTVDLVIEDVADIKALLAQVEFEPAQLELVGHQLHNQAGDFLTQHNGNVIALVDSALAQGTIGFNLAVAGGDQPGVDGSGTLLTLTFRKLGSGGTQVILGNSSRMVSSDLAEISILELAPAVIAAP